MKKYLLLLSLSLILTACSNEEPEVTTESEDSEEVARLKEENEELKRQQVEEAQQEDEDTEKQSTENEETSKDEESSTDSEETEQGSTDRSSLVFDINSPEVQSQLIGTNNGDTEGNFKQNVITVGMSQTEVEEMYGPYDYTLESPYGIVPAVYGNLSVLYSEGAPFGEGSDLSSTDIDPSNNMVYEVHLFANASEDELMNALGEPYDIYNNVDGSKTYHYQGTGDDGGYFNTNAETSITPDGKTIGVIKRNIEDENPDDLTDTVKEDSYFEDQAHTEGFPVQLTEEDDYFIYDSLRGFISRTYLPLLADFYNGQDDEILNVTTGNALQNIQDNKSSGAFENYQNIVGTEISSIEQISENEYSITVTRSYSHSTSDGEQTTQVTYTILDTDGMLKVSGF